MIYGLVIKTDGFCFYDGKHDNMDRFCVYNLVKLVHCENLPIRDKFLKNGTYYVTF